jgi:hypothetical protein
MARKYVRDNRGRFASGGSGATARGGRLRTASGNKRATQTMKAAGTGGVIKGRTARTVAGEKVMAKMAKRAPAAKRISAARPGGTVAKPKGLKPGVIKAKAGATRSRPPREQRIQQLKAKINNKSKAVLDELRKVDNAKNRNNDVGISPKYEKLVKRGEKAEKAARSVMKASKALRRIELEATPEKFGYARGSQQRKQMADQIRQARTKLTSLKKVEAAAKKAYEESPVVKYGLQSEIGGNRRQSRKAKGRASARQTSIVDSYVSAGMNTRAQERSIQDLRRNARAQTSATNKARRR